MPIVLFQTALVLILLHSVYQGVQAAQGGIQKWQNWGELIYRLAIVVASLSFFLDTL